MSLTIGSSSLVYGLLNSLSNLDAQTSNTMTRIATGLRINKASDDPAGLIALNNLNSDMAGVNAAIDTNNRSKGMLDVADSTLTEISSLVSEVQGLVQKGSDTTISASERAAYQAQIDDAVNSIDQLVNSTTYNGKALFGGDNRISVVTNSMASIKDLTVYRRDSGATTSATLNVSVTAVATRASANTTAILTAALSDDTTIEVTGALGTATLSFKAGTTGNQMMAAIKGQTAVTGVSAAAKGTALAIMSNSTGADQFVSLQVLSGSQTFENAATVAKTSGTDATVTVNNETANCVGTEVYYTGAGYSLSFNLAKNTATTTLSVTVKPTGGATFQLGSSASTQTSLGMGGVTSYELGRSDLGYLADLKSGGSQSLSVSGNKAAKIANEASSKVAQMAARVGSFNKYQIGSSLNVLNSTKESLAGAIDQVGSADYAEESATLQRQQVLQSAMISMLSIANGNAANVLALLR